MKHERYLNEAIEKLASTSQLPWHLADLPTDDVASFIHLVFNTMVEVADQNATDMTLELDEATICDMMRLAHERDITFNELVEEALELAVAKAKEEEEAKAAKPKTKRKRKK